MTASVLPTPRSALFACALAVVTVLTCAALVGAAVLVPAPAAALPLILPVGLGLPMLAAYELPTALAVLRAARSEALGRRDLARLRRALRQLPETHHPLGR